MTLEQLSAAATQGTLIHHGWGDGSTQMGMTNIFNEDAEVLVMECIPEADAAFIVALWNTYRTGQLGAVADDAIERVARTLAPNLEGGREFDQMPKDRAQLRQWTAQGMCLINDATQDDATWLAQEAIKAAKGTGDE